MIAETIKPRLVGIQAAAKYLGICPRKLWQLSKQKRIQTVRIDRAVRYDIADLDAFIAEMKGARKENIL